MYNGIRKIVKDSIEGINARILYGTVSSVSPFIVKVDQRFELSKQSLLIPRHLQEVKLRTTDLNDLSQVEKEYIINTKLKLDDKLILINLGEKYLIFDKVGDVDDTITITEE